MFRSLFDLKASFPNNCNCNCMEKSDRYIQSRYIWNNMRRINPLIFLWITIPLTIVRRDGSPCTRKAFSQLIKIKLSSPLRSALRLLIAQFLTASQRLGINFNTLYYSAGRLLTKQTVPSKAFLLFL